MLLHKVHCKAVVVVLLPHPCVLIIGVDEQNSIINNNNKDQGWGKAIYHLKLHH